MQERGLDAANAHDDDAMSQTFDEVFQRDVVFRTPLPTRASGVEAMKEIFVTLHRAFPDLHVSIDDLLEEGDDEVRCATPHPHSSRIVHRLELPNAVGRY